MDNSQQVKDVLQRVKQYYELATDLELAEFLGVSQPTISMWKSRGSMDSDLIITRCEDANLDWVFRGVGSPDSSGVTGFELERDDSGVLRGSLREAQAPYGGSRIGVPVHDRIGAGNLVYFEEVEPTEHIVVPEILTKLYPNTYYFRVEGWSMFPVVRPKAVVGINTDEKTIISGEMYGIWYDHEGASIKYLYTHSDKVIIKAENPKYPDDEKSLEELTLNDRFIIGRLRYLAQIYE